MIPANFDYFAPSTVDEALRLLAEHGDDAKVLSGGQSLIPVLKLRLAQPGVVIDIGRIAELDFIKVENNTVRIGALVTHAALKDAAEVRKLCPLMSECAAQIGDPQVRNRGTLAGSLVHADPAADWPAAMLALGAEVVARSASGERVIKAEDFFVDMLTTALEPGEIVTEVRVPVPAQPRAMAYLKVPQAASGFAVIGVAAQLTLDGGKIKEARVGVTGLAPKAFRASSVEAALIGQPFDEVTIKAAAEKADAEASDAMDDIHASGQYRRHLAKVYAGRAVKAAAARA